MATKLTVLFVDDDEKNCKVFKRYFAKTLDIAIITALSADEAINVLNNRQTGINMVITDQRMPKTKGHELLVHLQQHYPAIYRVLTSANQEEVEELLADDTLTEVIQHYFAKPWDFEDIKKTIYLAAN